MSKPALSTALALLVAVGCSHGSDQRTSGMNGNEEGGAGGDTGGSGGTTGTGGSGGTAGTGGSGGSAGTGGSGGTGDMPDATASSDDAASALDSAPAADDVAPAGDVMTGPTGPINYGGVGETPKIPLQYTAQPVPPIIAPECPGDPTMGFTEHGDSFVIQRPYDLAAADRFKYENGIYTFWVMSSDKAHAKGNTTAPRTEARYSDITTGEHLFSADVMYEMPSRTCITQIHNVVASIAMYLRVVGDRLFNLSTGKTILTGENGKWFNLKVYFNTQTHEVRTYVNNCLKETSKAPGGSPQWYYKHGVYTCDSGTCRSNFKNIHFYQRGSTDKFNTTSPFP